MDFSKICRLCCDTKQNMRLILDDESASCPLKEILRNVLQIEVSSDDHLPQKVCGECVETLIKLNQTIETFCENDIRLRRRLCEDVPIKLEEVEMETDPLEEQMALAQELEPPTPIVERRAEPIARRSMEQFLRANDLGHYFEFFKSRRLEMDHLPYFLQSLEELKEIIPCVRDRAVFTLAMQKGHTATNDKVLYAKPINYRTNARMASSKACPKVANYYSACAKTTNVETGDKITYDKAVQVELDGTTLTSQTNLFDICRMSEVGREFIDHYETNKTYESRFRNNIKKAVVGYYYKLYRGKLPEIIFEEMCALITNALPAESSNTWYQCRTGGVQPKGLLYSQYRHLQRKEREHTSADSGAREIATVPVKLYAEPTAIDITDDDDELPRMQHAKLFLNSNECKDKSEIMQHWINCFKLRRREALEGNFKLDDYSVLRGVENIVDLVNYDFRRLHPECAELAQRMPLFMSKFKQVVKEHRKSVDEERNLSSVLNDSYLHNFIVDDNSTFLAFLILPLILRPQFIANKGSKRTKPSLSMIKEAFIWMVETEASVEDAAESHRLAAKLKNQQVRPFIVAIGTYAEISSYYVVFEHHSWKLETSTAAVDLFFKLHSVFNLEYDCKLTMVMKFLQQYFYDIRYEGQGLDAAVEMLISDCNRY